MLYRQPKYYADFKCIGGECINSCCSAWRIDWNEKEVERLKSAENASPLLRELIETSFEKPKNGKADYIIKLKDGSDCPFLTEERLCRIQKELGEEYLSETCACYPRKRVYSQGLYYDCCRISCPEIVKKLLNDEKCMRLANTQGPDIARISNNPDEADNNPKFLYRADIFELLYEFISDKNIELERAIMLGAIAAERLTKLVDCGECGLIPSEIKTLRQQLRNDATMQIVNNVKPNLKAKLSFLPMITEQIVEETVTKLLHPEGEYIDLEAYHRGEQRLHEALEGRGFFLRNLALALLLEMDVPFEGEKRSFFENYCLFAVTFACIKLNLIAGMSIDSPIEMNLISQNFVFDGVTEKIIGLTAVISRGLCQSETYSNMIFRELQEHDFCNHAYLAAFVL